MTTATLQKSEEKTGSWASVFPTEQVTEQQSALFVKRLLAVSISNITYLRAIFPERAFGDRCLEDLNLKILRNDSCCPGACQVITWMKGCFDALDKKYIYADPNKPETVIESYTFKFTYTNEPSVDIYRNKKKISTAHSPAETKKATIRLLRTIVVLTQTLQSLPDDVMMTMKLLYYDDCTPPEYEPPGFKPCDSDAFTFEEEPLNIKVGDVSTPFHLVKMRIKTDGKQLEVIDNIVENESEIEMEEEKKEISDSGLDVDTEIQNSVSDLKLNDKEKVDTAVEEANEVPSNEGDPNQPEEGIELESQTDNPNEIHDENAVRCPCGCNEDDGLMIMCSECKFWQHGVCFCVIKEEEAPENHICDICAKPGKMGQEPTDPQLCEMTSIDVQALCLWRKTLMACLESSRILAPHLAQRLGIEITIAQGLIHRLEKEGFVCSQKRGRRLGMTVNKDKIKKIGIPSYITRKEETNTEQQLEISSLVKQTEEVTLSGRRKSKRNHNKENISESDEIPYTRQLRGRKRAFSKTDSSKEFELSDSQDFEEPSKIRRRKSSIVSKSILV